MGKEAHRMLEDFLEHPFSLNRHRQAPLLKEREAFLSHLQQQGTSRKALRNLAGTLLHVIRLLKLNEMRDVSLEEIQRVARQWARQQRSNPRARSYGNSALSFVYAGKKWLRFHGRLRLPSRTFTRFADPLNDFARYMTEERGLSQDSVRSHCTKTSKFLQWFEKRHRSLARARVQDVDEFLVMKGASGWSRRSVAANADALRAFFRYAETRGWCVPGLANGIQGPRIYKYENLPQGPSWEEVKKLLESVKGADQAALRARAILSLLATYGLRSGEISRLLLSDFDWREEVFVVNHSKRGGPQRYPLQRQVGDAILQYLKGGRPRCTCRHLFVTLTPPYRSLSVYALWTLTSRRLKAAGIQCQRRGPHVLRHACATRLLTQGASFKEIADLLGHRSLESVGIYAKVDLAALRAIAVVGLGGLA
jgi:integrase/recombinase XerD